MTVSSLAMQYDAEPTTPLPECTQGLSPADVAPSSSSATSDMAKVIAGLLYAACGGLDHSHNLVTPLCWGSWTPYAGNVTWHLLLQQMPWACSMGVRAFSACCASRLETEVRSRRTHLAALTLAFQPSQPPGKVVAAAAARLSQLHSQQHQPATDVSFSLHLMLSCLQVSPWPTAPQLQRPPMCML